MGLATRLRSAVRAVLPPVVTSGARRLKRLVAPVPAPVTTTAGLPGAVYEAVSADLHDLLIADALAKFLKARTGRTSFRAAYVGHDPQTFKVVEALRDCGFQEDYFAGREDDEFHAPKPLSRFEPTAFDVALVGDVDQAREEQLAAEIRCRAAGGGCTVVRFRQLVSAHVRALREIRAENYFTCLNPRKLSLIAAAVYMSPPEGAVVECGVFMGGTTVYVGLLQRFLGLVRPIYALDTFAGMPAPTQKDFGGGMHYRAGLFNETRLDVVASVCRAHGLEGAVRLVSGLVQDTLPAVLKESPRVAFAFLDTDQYAGTAGGLAHVLPAAVPGALVIIDDTGVTGVDRAINEALEANPGLRRHPVSGNFDLLLRD